MELYQCHAPFSHHPTLYSCFSPFYVIFSLPISEQSDSITPKATATSSKRPSSSSKKSAKSTATDISQASFLSDPRTDPLKKAILKAGSTDVAARWSVSGQNRPAHTGLVSKGDISALDYDDDDDTNSLDSIENIQESAAAAAIKYSVSGARKSSSSSSGTTQVVDGSSTRTSHRVVRQQSSTSTTTRAGTSSVLTQY